jgi:hypothetical protein
MTKLAFAAGVLLAFGACVQAQDQGPIPGSRDPYPYPPGRLPPVQPPNIPGKSSGKNKHKSASSSLPTISAEGLTASSNAQMLVILTNDGRRLTMSVTPQTAFARAGAALTANQILPRSTVHVDAAEDEEAYLTAVKVELLKDPPVERPADDGAADTSKPAANPDDEELAKPTILKNPVAVPDRPVLRHGASKTSERASAGEARPAAKPAGSTSADGETDFTIDEDSPKTRPGSRADALVEETKQWALTFTNGLPNYVCDQLTTRYMQRSRRSEWEPQDVISAKVVYEDGHEDYKDIAVGGKKTNKSMMDLGGSTSTGEFASTLRSLFSSQTNAEFKLYESSSVGGNAASIYDFKVLLHNSDWLIKVGGQELLPAYSGSVWVDKHSAEVRRIEMQADNIPKDFPLDSVEMAIDYDKVRLGTQEYLLPIHSENLSCWRGQPICTKNAIDFRDYHKYTGESTIEFK